MRACRTKTRLTRRDAAHGCRGKQIQPMFVPARVVSTVSILNSRTNSSRRRAATSQNWSFTVSYSSAATAETTRGPSLSPVSLFQALWLPSHSGCFLLFQQRQIGVFLPTWASYISFIGIASSGLSGSAAARGTTRAGRREEVA